MPAKIVLLNGVGSAGKSSITKALQKIAAEPFLHVEMDAFLAMIPDAYQNHPDGISFDRMTEDGKPSIAIRTGDVVERALKGMRHSIAAMAYQGNNMIVDEVIFGNVDTGHGNAFAEYQSLLADFQLHLVGVFASLEILEERECRRNDRQIGFARWQYDRVHKGMVYDLEIDSGRMTPEECARVIKERFAL